MSRSAFVDKLERRNAVLEDILEGYQSPLAREDAANLLDTWSVLLDIKNLLNTAVVIL